MFSKHTVLAIVAPTLLALAACSAPSGDDAAAAETASDLSASASASPVVARAIQIFEELEGSSVSGINVVAISITGDAVALAGQSFHSRPVHVKVETQRFGQTRYELLGTEVILDVDATNATATATGYTIDLPGQRITIENNNQVSFSAPALVSSEYPSIAHFTASRPTSRSLASVDLSAALSYDAFTARERTDTTGSWRGKTKELSVGDVQVQCWVRSNGDHDRGCEANISGGIVGEKNGKLVVEAVLTPGTTLAEALPGNGSTRNVGGITCNAARCVIRGAQD